MNGGIRITSYDMAEVSIVDHAANLDAMLTNYPGQTSPQRAQRAYTFKSINLDDLVGIPVVTKDLGSLIPEDLGEKAADSSEIQSLLFDKDKFTEAEATKWAGDHDFKHNKVDITDKKIRLRQFDPAECEKDTFGTKSLTDGVEAIFCVKSKSLATPPPEKNSQIPPEEEGDRRKSMEELKQDTPAVEPTPEVKTEPTPEIKAEVATEEKAAPDMTAVCDKMDACIGKMDELMKHMDSMMGGQEDMSKEPEVKKELDTPATEPVLVKEVETEVAKPETDLTAEKAFAAMVNLVSELGKKQDGMKDTIMAEVKGYIEELRAPVAGKASMAPTAPVEKKSRDEELKGMKPKELEAETKKVIAQLFENLKQ
jgi:hypothetical protein